MATEGYNQQRLFDEEIGKDGYKVRATSKTSRVVREKTGELQAYVAKAVRSQVPDFDKADRAPSCLEINFPIVPVNRLARQEGNAGKPVYQMSKWWARRRSSVFRAMLLAAATQAPEHDEPFTAAKRIWDVYYANHQQAGSFAHLHVLDPFMGGGTTLVEGARLGMHMYGMDLNPVAWLVVKNEMAGSAPEQVQAFFDAIEVEVKPQIQPFYATTCPRGHRGQWIDTRTNEPAVLDPLSLSPQQRLPYRWQGPEVIYTFWAKHCPCPATDCGHRTPIFKTLLIAEKKLTTNYLALQCPKCHLEFDTELGATRMAPGVQRVVLASEKPFTETSQQFAQLLLDYEKGTREERDKRLAAIQTMILGETALCCPNCGTFAAQLLLDTVEKHLHPGTKESKARKKDLNILRKTVYMQLLIHPNWLQGSPNHLHGAPLGGFAGANPEATAEWYRVRAENLSLIEVRGRAGKGQSDAMASNDLAEGTSETTSPEDTASEPDAVSSGDVVSLVPHIITLPDGASIDINQGTVPAQSTCTCMACGRRNDLLTAMKASGQTAPTMAYALQCYCPTCEAEGYNYGGRFFKSPDADDIARMAAAEAEWSRRAQSDLRGFWPLEELPYAHMTHERQPLPQNGYTHWWKMFNSRQLLVHASLLRAITTADPARWPLDVREQALGAFQQYLRNQNMFCFWNIAADKLEPMFSNANYHPKGQVLENAVFSPRGRGTWISATEAAIEGLTWCRNPWESFLDDEPGKSEKRYPGDAVVGEPSQVYCGSSTELPFKDGMMDMVITDPPFGDNVFYADLADFFYVWLRIPLLRWYAGQRWSEAFGLPATPKALEVITNRAEHPDTRDDEERKQPDSRPPADEFYQHTLTVCWQEAYRVLKPGGLLAFTFHHSADGPWIDVLESLFEAGFILVATYPIRSDETKGESAQFGSKKIEYDMIHVCRKRLSEPAETISWANMRLRISQEVTNLWRMLGAYQVEGDLSEADIHIILRGKALEFYSRYYGHVVTITHEPFSIREALLGISVLLNDMMGENKTPPPDVSSEITRLFLTIFAEQSTLSRDELHKRLRGNIVGSSEFLNRGWLREGANKTYYVPSIQERMQDLRKPGRRRDTIKSDLDQAHFFIGAALPHSGIIIEQELQEGKIKLHDDIEVLLRWYATHSGEEVIRSAAALAQRAIAQWHIHKKEEQIRAKQPSLFEEDRE